jgi:hypothetical protein
MATTNTEEYEASNSPTTPEQWASFASKMEWEGGVTGVLDYGGSDFFPVEARPAAKAAEVALATLTQILAQHGASEES